MSQIWRELKKEKRSIIPLPTNLPFITTHRGDLPSLSSTSPTVRNLLRESVKTREKIIYSSALDGSIFGRLDNIIKILQKRELVRNITIN
eukprot:scaffold37590_cov155-Skeletonema_dohrnii-CCMP3373.AAC.4